MVLTTQPVVDLGRTPARAADLGGGAARVARGGGQPRRDTARASDPHDLRQPALHRLRSTLIEVLTLGGKARLDGWTGQKVLAFGLAAHRSAREGVEVRL